MKWIKQHKLLVAVVAVVLILALALVSYVWSKLNLIQYDDGTTAPQQTVESAPAEAPEIPEPPEPEDVILDESDLQDLTIAETEPDLPDSPIWNDSQVLNVLLIGTDERTEEFSTNARSDSMILMSINKDSHAIKLISLERGMGVPILEGEYAGQYDWLTHVFRYGGADLLLKTVQTCFSVEVEHYVRINFHTLAAAVDAIGGVDVELTQAEADYLNDPNARHMWMRKEPRPVSVGLNHMDGVTALTYARIRAIDSDWQRVERQRKVIIAMIDQVKSSGLTGLDELANQVLPLVQTNFTKLELAELLLIAPGFLDAEIDQMTIPVAGSYGGMYGMGGRTLYAVDFETNAAILQEYLYGPQSLPEQDD